MKKADARGSVAIKFGEIMRSGPLLAQAVMIVTCKEQGSSSGLEPRPAMSGYKEKGRGN